jgi:hypothetical protein
MIINEEEIIGLEIMEEEPNFSYKGCENCGKRYGDNVYPVAAHIQVKKGTTPDWYEIDLCNTCIFAYNNGEPLEEGCKNKFKI